MRSTPWRRAGRSSAPAHEHRAPACTTAAIDTFINDGSTTRTNIAIASRIANRQFSGGGESVAALLAVGAIALGSLVYWLLRRKCRGQPTLLDPDLFRIATFRLGISGQMLQQIALGGCR